MAETQSTSEGDELVRLETPQPERSQESSQDRAEREEAQRSVDRSEEEFVRRAEAIEADSVRAGLREPEAPPIQRQGPPEVQGGIERRAANTESDGEQIAKTFDAFGNGWSRVNATMMKWGKDSWNWAAHHPKTTVALGAGAGYMFYPALYGLALANPIAASAIGVGALASYIAKRNDMKRGAKYIAAGTAGIGAAMLFPLAASVAVGATLLSATGPTVAKSVAGGIRLFSGSGGTAQGTNVGSGSTQTRARPSSGTLGSRAQAALRH